jgi:hypothetical protein
MVTDPISMLKELEIFSYLDVKGGFTDEEKDYWGEDIAYLSYNLSIPPRDVINGLLAEPEKAKLLLHRVLDYTLEKYMYLEDDEITHIYALYLLAQLRDKDAYPKILELMNYNDIEDDSCILTKVFMQDGFRIVASVFDGNIEPLLEVMQNPYDTLLGRQIALRTLFLLNHLNKIDRETLLEIVHNQIDNLEAEENTQLLGLLVLDALIFNLHEVYDRIGESFQNDAIDPEIISLEIYEQMIAEGFPAVQQHTLINDVFEEIESLECT